jgi:hypothetical protein
VSFGLLVEGAKSAVLACSLGLLVPALGALLAVKAGFRFRSAAVFSVAAGIGAWLSVAGWTRWADSRIVLAALVGGGVLALSRGDRLVRLGGVTGVGVFAGMTWTPCVGEHFGTVLTTGIRDPWPALLPLVGYVVAVLFGTLILAALLDFVSGLDRVSTSDAMRGVGIGLLGVLVLLVAFDRYDALLSELVRISLRQ